MGVFDPNGKDDERQEGNIYGAILNFPARHSFTVIGKTCGEEKKCHTFISQVKDIVVSQTKIHWVLYLLNDSPNKSCYIQLRLHQQVGEEVLNIFLNCNFPHFLSIT